MIFKAIDGWPCHYCCVLLTVMERRGLNSLKDSTNYNNWASTVVSSTEVSIPLIAIIWYLKHHGSCQHSSKLPRGSGERAKRHWTSIWAITCIISLISVADFPLKRLSLLLLLLLTGSSENRDGWCLFSIMRKTQSTKKLGRDNRSILWSAWYMGYQYDNHIIISWQTSQQQLLVIACPACLERGHIRSATIMGRGFIPIIASFLLLYSVFGRVMLWWE